MRPQRLSVLTTSLAGVVAVVIAWLAVGADGPLSAVLGALMVLGFFAGGGLPFFIARQGLSGLAFLMLGMGYVLRILLGVVIYSVAIRASGIDRQVVGLTVIGCALVWVNTQVFSSLLKRNRPTLDLEVGDVRPLTEKRSSRHR